MFRKILIANRGEIACRIMTSARKMGISCVAIYSDADKNAKHVELSDEAWRIGPAEVSESYLKMDDIIDIALKSGAEAIHPGYGFLSENPDFVDKCDAAGIRFIGPSATAIRAMGLKDAAKKLMLEAGVPVVPGYHEENQDPTVLAQAAQNTGYPVLIKARAGGGGKGMRLVNCADEFNDALASAQRESAASFGDDSVLIEKFVSNPRHIELQVFADQHGNVVHLFERDCSLQRRHQKVIEEAPAPGMTDIMRTAMGDAAIKACHAVEYCGAGTVEFIVDSSDGLRADRFWFMEMNTRLQVEHPVTEAITGQDLVEWQLRVAFGETLPLKQEELTLNGHAFEARLYAEDPEKGFLPAIGKLSYLNLPDEHARVDSGVRQGDEVSPYYDPMIAKLITHASDRHSALNKLNNALSTSYVSGCKSNIAFLHRLTTHDGFREGDFDTGLIDRELDALVSIEPPDHELIAVAAMVSSGLLTPADSPDPWDSLQGWRQWNSAQQFVHLLWRDQAIECSVHIHNNNELSVQIDQQTLHLNLVSIESNRIRVLLDGRIRCFTVLNTETLLTLYSESVAYEFSLPDHFIDDEDSGSSEDKLLAPMPGKIIALSAVIGDAVTSGDRLLVMEAMKMEQTITAPRDGIVAEVCVLEGEQVTDGALLLRLEERLE